MKGNAVRQCLQPAPPRSDRRQDVAISGAAASSSDSAQWLSCSRTAGALPLPMPLRLKFLTGNGWCMNGTARQSSTAALGRTSSAKHMVPVTQGQNTISCADPGVEMYHVPRTRISRSTRFPRLTLSGLSVLLKSNCGHCKWLVPGPIEERQQTSWRKTGRWSARILSVDRIENFLYLAEPDANPAKTPLTWGQEQITNLTPYPSEAGRNQGPRWLSAVC